MKLLGLAIYDVIGSFSITLVVLFCLVIQSCDRDTATASLNDSEFRQLLNTVAKGWNTGDALLAANCFSQDAVYSSPPSSHIRSGREALFQFFGGHTGRSKPMSMEWHHIVFDERNQIGMGEYTFTYAIRTHGVAVIKVRGGRIANWREYEIESPLSWNELVGANRF